MHRPVSDRLGDCEQPLGTRQLDAERMERIRPSLARIGGCSGCATRRCRSCAPGPAGTGAAYQGTSPGVDTIRRNGHARVYLRAAAGLVGNRVRCHVSFEERRADPCRPDLSWHGARRAARWSRALASIRIW